MTLPRLNEGLLAELRGIARPEYNRSELQAGILHIGVGAFHRAHQAVFTEDVLSAGGGSWGIVGASLRSSTAERQLAPQNGLYTVNTLSPAGVERRIIGAIRHVFTAASDDGFREIVRTMSDPAIHIITLTVTEKGYCQRVGALNIEHADVQHDLTSTASRRSLPGVLAAGLEARRLRGAGPITLLSCDNLATNGRVLRQVVMEYADLAHPGLTGWLEANASFPCTMVDRIVPATSDQDHMRLAADLGFTDAGMVCCEPFKQWVIEDNFAGPRPPWEDVGALLVNDVTGYERAKLQLLNGSHSASAYLGILRGHAYVHEAMQDPVLRRFLAQLVEREILPHVPPLPDLDQRQYVHDVFTRFANPSIAYRTRQVGSDGSQKLPQRLVPTARARLLAGGQIERLAIVFAAWIEHLADPAPDPLGASLQKLYTENPESEKLVAAINKHTPVFSGLAEVEVEFTAAVSKALKTLRTRGLEAALTALS